MADLAASQGSYRYGQDAFNRGLQLDQNDRANSALAFGQQEAQDNGVESALRTILSDVTRRQTSQDQFDNRLGLQNLKGDQTIEQILTKGGIQSDLARYIQDQVNSRKTADINSRDSNAAAGRDLREKLGNDANDTKLYGIDTTSTDRNRAIDSRQQLEQQKMEERQSLERLKTSEQQRRANLRLDAQTKAMMIKAELSDLRRLGQINETRARYGDMEAAGRIGGINEAITRKIKELGIAPMRPETLPFFPGSAPASPPALPGDVPDGEGPTPMGLQGPPTPAGPQQPVVIQSEQEYVQLPPGTLYVAPDGTVRQKQ